MALGSLVDAGADLDEIGASCERLPVERVGARGRAGHCGAASRPPTSRVVAEATTVRAHRRPHHRADRGGPPARAGARRGPSPCSRRSPRPRGASTAARPSRSTSTRWAASTPSSTSSARAPRSRCSASTRSTPAPSPPGVGMVRSAHGLIPNPAPAMVELLASAPTYGVDIDRRAHHARPVRPCSPPWPPVRADAAA